MSNSAEYSWKTGEVLIFVIGFITIIVYTKLRISTLDFRK